MAAFPRWEEREEEAAARRQKEEDAEAVEAMVVGTKTIKMRKHAATATAFTLTERCKEGEEAANHHHRIRLVGKEFFTYNKY